MADFSHLNEKAEGQMVDISAKGATPRRATVCSSVAVSEACAGRLTPEMAREIAVTARIAGVQAGKQTATLIPYCHPVSLSQITCDITFEGSTFQVAVTARTVATTGVEMEAMVAASIA